MWKVPSSLLGTGLEGTLGGLLEASGCLPSALMWLWGGLVLGAEFFLVGCVIPYMAIVLVGGYLDDKVVYRSLVAY